jgi:hypothetical protein
MVVIPTEFAPVSDGVLCVYHSAIRSTRVRRTHRCGSRRVWIPLSADADVVLGLLFETIANVVVATAVLNICEAKIF